MPCCTRCFATRSPLDWRVHIRLSRPVMPSRTEAVARAHLIKLYREKPCMPIMVRLAWHDAGTYCAITNTGGANGTVRFEPEASHGANAGLKWAVNVLEEIRAHVPNIGYADLYQLASVVAIEFAGGPSIPFRSVPLGRVDATENDMTADGRLPDGKKAEEHLRDVFYRMGFIDKEIVVLSGAHTLGRGHPDRSGFEGAWTSEPLIFDNRVLLEKDADPSLLKLPSDAALLNTLSMRRWVEAYAKDEQLFFKDYAAAHVKLSTLGQFQD